MIDARRRCSSSYALARLAVTPRQLAELVRCGRLARPSIEAPDFDLSAVDDLAAELEAERRNT